MNRFMRERRPVLKVLPVLGALAGAGTLAAALYALWGERSGIVLSEYTLEMDRPGLPPNGLTLLHISDLHLRAEGRVQTRRLAALRRLLAGRSYDLLLTTGDLIHNEGGFPLALQLLADLQPRLAAFSVPGNHDYCEYTVLGNEVVAPGAAWPVTLGRVARHAWRLVIKILANQPLRQPLAFHNMAAAYHALAAAGVEPLINCSAHLQEDGVDLWVAGVDDFVEGRPDIDRALAHVPPGALLVLLAHNPDAWLDAKVETAALVLSGHTHGGQVRLPVFGAIHTQGTHLSRRRPAGWFRRGGTHFFVTRGAGESLPLRLGARPEITLIHLRPSSANL